MRLVFMGTPEFAVPSLERLAASGCEIACVVTRPDRPRGRGRKLQPTPVKVASERLGLPVYQPESLRDADTVGRLKSFDADLFVVVAFVVLPRAVLGIPPQGCVNLHPSLLPKYRGAAPIQWAVINGDRETGATTILLTGRVDAGDILLQERTLIGPQETAGELHDRLMVMGAQLIAQSVEGLTAGSLEPRPQGEGATRAPKLEREDGRIDWSQDAEVLRNLIRGTNPIPGAFTEHDGRPLKVLRAAVGECIGDVPGTVLRADPTRGVEVATGRGSLMLTEVQPSGKRAMTGAEYVRGSGIKRGDQLGEKAIYD